MKKIIILFLFVFGIMSVQAQKSKVQSANNFIKPEYNELNKAKEAIDAATVNESTANWDKTWYFRGKVYHAIYQSTDTVFKALHENPLREAVDAYVKAIELDVKERYTKDIINRLNTAAIQFLNLGIVHFNEGKYSDAFNAFENSVYVNALPQINTIDSMAMFNAAIAADRANNYEKAVEFYQKTANIKYEGVKVYLFLSNAYKAKGDTVSAIKAIKAGIEAWPEDNNMLMVDMINFYLNANRTNEALEYLNKAIEKDPENYSYYFAVGTLYDKNNDYENAIANYKKGIELNADFFDANYNLGAVYYNTAVSHYTVANDIPASDQKGYDAEIEKAKVQLKLALPFLEKAYELNDADFATIQSLKEIYVRLQMYDKSKLMKERLLELNK